MAKKVKQAAVKPAPAFARKLATALRSGLRKHGFAVKVEYERVPLTKRYRFYVFSPKFERLWHSERQAMVWQIAEKTLTPDEHMNVSMILALEPLRRSAA